MCGIAGYIGKKELNKVVINKTLDLMKNRGPDHQAWSSFSFNDTNIYLLHSRLSIIDLDERSNQPFSFDGYTLIFNGEIYNYLEIREALKKCGHVFSTNSDTEVLIKAYIQYGDNCVNYFNGMWAFAIWDERSNKLLLSRDRFAEKPLHYYQDNHGVYFASEVKAIQSLIQKKLQINYNFLKRQLVYGYKFLNKTPETYFHGVRQLDYGSNVTIDYNLNFVQSKYWKPEISRKEMSLDSAIEGTRSHLLDSVKLRLRSDVPLAFCLSGGVDSASLASIAKKVFNYDVTTFSIIDSDERYNEYQNIKATVDDLECENFFIHLNFKNMLNRLKSLIKYHDSPISTISYLVHSMLSEKIKEQGYKVAISGTSADELFTGYYDHFNLHLYEMREHSDFENYLKDWQNNTGKIVRNPNLKNPKLYFENQSFRDHIHLNSPEFKTFLKDDFAIEFTEEQYSESLLRNRMLNELFHESTPVILQEDDLNSMRFSIENRSPFLDLNLFNFAYSIPNEHLIKDGFGKFTLRESMAGILNNQVRLDKAKKGFNASLASLFDFKDNDTVDYFLSESPVFDFISRSKIEKILKKEYLENSYNKFIFNFINAKLFVEQFN